ncbi:tRNA (adenine(58)-N(1))-methyltransferase non-catalytic subunit trm6 [Cerrena zonata]|uniref:tRNA (adenine(58)-N(1))-methyltransferase non-catalytic subunit TRM6 n=1 Tax=Cerrena zonata TaxID=2478898 RepID=A0AAW0GBH0_9APHY
MTDQTVDIPEEEEAEQEINKDTLTQLFTNSAENNQNIINIGSKIQKLTSEEIDKIKKSGASSDAGQKIIEQIIAGHGGFDKKTIYSQQKYLKRKQQKFLKRFSVEYLGGSQLLEYSILRDLQKVLDMSEESMALLMTYGNVRPGGNYLLIDETGGVLLYAMMERMQGQGTITIIHENEHPNIIALRYSDYPIELQERMVKTINWLQVVEPENEKIIWEDLPVEEVDSMKSNKKKVYQRGNFDALISVSSLDMTGVLPYLIPKIGGSRPIVLYNQFKEVLLDIQHYLSNDKRVLAPSIYESRVRPYQTIPGRLHPMMTSRGYGGYVLWGTKVIPVEGGLTAVGRGNQLKKKSTPVEDAKVKSEASLDSKASETPEPAKLS